MKNLFSSLRVVCVVLFVLMFAACTKRAEVYVTSGKGDVQFRFSQFNNAELRDVNPAEGDYIKVLSESHRQPVYGFGAAITGSTCYNLLQMSETDREIIRIMLKEE